MNNPSGLTFAFGEAPVSTAKANRKQPVQSRSQATCAAILEATIQVLVQQGIERLTTTRVAERAGVSVGTLYQYYPNKAALTEAVRTEYFRVMSEAVTSNLATPETSDPVDRLGAALEAILEVKRKHSALSLALAKVPTDENGSDFSADVVRHFASVLVPIVAGSAEPTLAAQKEALAIVAAIEGALSFAVKNEPDWLYEPWFVDNLKGLAQVGVTRMAKALATPPHPRALPTLPAEKTTE